MQRILLLATLLCTSMAMASDHQAHKAIKLYQAPNTNSKVLATLNPKHGLTLVKTNWIQAFDPKSKQTGWIKKPALEQGQHIGLTTINHQQGQSPDQSYRIIEYSGQQPSNQDIANLIKRTRAHEKTMHQEFERSMRQADALFESLMPRRTVVVQPVIMPPDNLKTAEARKQWLKNMRKHWQDKDA